MAIVHSVPQVPDVDNAPIRWAPWLTHRRLLLFVIGWLALFAVIGVFVSNPFQSETSAAATPDYAKVMFLHGLLIGMVGLLALLTCQVLALRSLHVRVWVTGGVVVATMLAAVGGIWDRTIPGSEVPMWTQILGFFALDEILIVLLYGMIREWRTARTAHTLPYVAAMLAAGSMFLAAIMGHLAGWIMEFGNFPKMIGQYANFAGIGTAADFSGALVGSHSHEMAMGVMALTIILVAQQFGYAALTGAPRVLSRVGRRNDRHDRDVRCQRVLDLGATDLVHLWSGRGQRDRQRRHHHRPTGDGWRPADRGGPAAGADPPVRSAHAPGGDLGLGAQLCDGRGRWVRD